MARPGPTSGDRGRARGEEKAQPRRRSRRGDGRVARALSIAVAIAVAAVVDAFENATSGVSVDAMPSNSSASAALGSNYFSDRGTAWEGYLAEDPSLLARAWQHFGYGRYSSWRTEGNGLGIGDAGGDTISSVWVKDGYRLRLWQHGSGNGLSGTFYGGYSNINYNPGDHIPDQASDADVEREAPCTIFRHDRGLAPQGGWFDAWDVGVLYSNLGSMDNAVESLYVAPGYKCTLYRDVGEGTSKTYYPGWHMYHETVSDGLRGQASSMKVERAPSGYLEFDQNAKAIAWQYYQNGNKVAWTETGDSLSLAPVGGDQISSVWVKDGYRLMLWEHPNRGGAVATFFGGYTNLHYRGEWIPDKASDASLHEAPPCTLFDGDVGCGAWYDLWQLDKMYTVQDFLAAGFNDRAASLYVAPGYKCTLWNGDTSDELSEDSFTFYPGWHYALDFHAFGGYDRASSAQVTALTSSAQEEGCYPATGSRMIFPANSHQHHHRVAVWEDGKVMFNWGNGQHVWTSISNVAYAVKGRRPLELASGWTNRNGAFSTASYSCADGIVSLGGTIVGSSNGGIIATLPSGCRPTQGQLIFNGAGWVEGVGGSIVRVDVATNGNIIASAHAAGEEVSLEGIVFAISGHSPMTFTNGWFNYNEGYAPLEVYCGGGLVVLSGLVRPGSWGNCIAYLPANCRPAQGSGEGLIFSVNTHDTQSRVNVRGSDGCVYTGPADQTKGWISLSGIVFAMGRSEWAPLDRWYNHGGGWDGARYACTRGGLVVLSGLIRPHDWSAPMFTLPSHPPSACSQLHPSKALVFVANQDDSLQRLNFDSAGGVYLAAGYRNGGWSTLTSIHWASSQTDVTTFSAGWRNLDEYWSPAKYSCSGGLVTVSGLVAAGTWGQCITYLPANCRPRASADLLFTVDNHDAQSRVHVRGSDGCIHHDGGSSAYGWLSLSGIIFSTTQNRRLMLENGWVNHNGGYAQAQYSCVDGLVVVAGLIKDGPQGHVATLPPGCRPKGALLFAANHHQYQWRVNIYTNGEIHARGIHAHSWVSLSGISFSTSDAQHGLKMAGDWDVYGYGWAPPQFSCVRGIMSLQGLAKPSSGTASGDLIGTVRYDYPPPPSPPPSPPPPSPPPSPPPPSPPPPGSKTEVSVSLTNPASLVSTFSYDFGVRVAHPSACDGNCFESALARQNAKAAGLRCTVTVQKDGTDCSGKWSSEHMPCRQWNDFQPSSLEMVDNRGKILTGDYTIRSSCHFVLANGNRVNTPAGADSIIHRFRLLAGCSDNIPAGNAKTPLENVARYLLLTADEFNVADCRDQVQIYKTKEAIFRRYDNNPEDGTLSRDEIAAALMQQSADTHILDSWNEEVDGALELKPSQVMRAKANDMECGTGHIVFHDTVYPTDSPGRESTDEQCRQNATFMRVTWRYSNPMTLGDFVCVYIDGMLYEKRSTMQTAPNFEGYSLLSNGLYAVTELTDIRPVSGTYEDTQQSLVANFVFDDDDASHMVSASPKVMGNKNRGVPSLTPIERERAIGRCEGGDGALCLKPVATPIIGAQYGYRYKEFDFTEDVAITSWVRGTCANNPGDDARRMGIAYFSGTNAGIQHVLRFYVKMINSSMSLILEYVQNTSTIYRLELTGIACSSWQYVGFSLNKRDRMVLFANPSGNIDVTGDSSTYKVLRSMPPDAPSKMLKLMTSLDLFGAVDVEFDDVRVYTGQVSRATFIDAFSCGHRSLCVNRAHARPSSRRVVCAIAVVAGQSSEQQTDTFCTPALYYDGAAIDVIATLGMSGVTFTYRDTSWQEKSFEMLRKSVDGAASSYETVIQMDGDLLGCVNKFNSITHVDRDAGMKPNLNWYYKVRTKTTANSQDFVSTTHFFKVPWIGMIEGKVTAGTSTSPVPYVRVCADFSSLGGTLVTPKSDTELRNLALFMRAEHTNDVVKTAKEDTYVVTDGDPTPDKGSALISQGEYLRVELARWSSIKKVQVCVVTGSSKPLAYVQEYDSGISGDHGNPCEHDDSLTLVSTSHTCFEYKCRGSHLTSFHGKFITATVPRSEGVDDKLPLDGLYAWFENRNAGVVWPSSVGNLVGEVVQGKVTVKLQVGNGSPYPVRALHGDSSAQFDLGRALPQGDWTLCTLSRYDGPARGRIIQGSGNMLHGHYSARRGVAYYEGWMSQRTVGVVSDWNVMCGTNRGRRLYVDDINMAQGDLNGGSSDKYLGINYAKDACCSHEKSDWAVAEIMTWSRSLSEDEMKRVTRYLRDVTLGPKAQVTEISVSASKTNCRFTDVSDAGGAYEVFVKDTTELIPSKTTMLVGAYKEETFPRVQVQLIDASRRATASKPQMVMLVLVKQTGSSTSSTPRAFATVDVDNSTGVSKSELQAHIETVSGFPTTGRAIIVDALWKEFDSDGDGFLSLQEFNSVSVKMRTGELKVHPLLVYPIIDAKYLSDFNEERESGQACTKFVLVNYNSPTLPRNSTDWNDFYGRLVSDEIDLLLLSRRACEPAQKMVTPVGNGNSTHVLPLIGQGPNGDPISLANDDDAAQSEVDIYSRVIPASAPSISLKATQRYHDIVHLIGSGVRSERTEFDLNLFSSEAKFNVTEVQIRHRSTMEIQFQDETTVIVRGAVLFPTRRVAGSTRCGVFAATIKVREVDGEGEPEQYKTDESGWFDIAVTRGKSFTFTATFPNHTVCYTGKTVADATAESSCSNHPAEVTLVRLIDNAYIFFTDVTKANIDLGLYQGQCEQLYKGARFKITPVNGCHASQYVTSAEVNGWMTDVKGLPDAKFTDDEPLPKNARVWPYAAMDYSIVLDAGPDLGPLGDKIKNEAWYEGCATEAGSVVDFFRRRNALERLALMRDENAWQQIRFKYHGWICVDVPDIPVISAAYKSAMCYDENRPSGSLTPDHFVGISHAVDLPFPMSPDREIHVKIFEIHSNPASERGYDMCFARLPDKQQGTGSTVVKIRQDVSNPEDSECHSERGGGEACDFQVHLTKDGELVFPDSTQTNAVVISAGSPNLASTHRRVISVEVTRNDLFVSVTAKAIRELIPLGSKPRVGSGLSDVVNWATVPLEGMVYSVVHDPPGGDSYAEISAGTVVKIEYSLASSRAAKAGGKFKTDIEKGGKGKFEIGLNLGYTAEVATKMLEGEFGGEVKSAIEFKSPEFSVSSSSVDAWDIALTTQRVLRSSQDEQLPGRAGDAILGAGIELLYTTSDVLDFAPKNGRLHCLELTPTVTWLPRKPTSYFVNVHEIEAKILPNLKFLRSVALRGDIRQDNSLRPLDVDKENMTAVNEDWAAYITQKIGAWERTLRWASPAEKESVSNIIGSYTGPDSIIGDHLQDKVEAFSDAFHEPFSLHEGPMADLAREWMLYGLLEIDQVWPVLAFSAFMAPEIAGITTAYAAVSGPLVFLSENRLLKYIDTPGLSLTYPRVDSTVPNYNALLKEDSGELFYSFAMNEHAREARESPRDSADSTLDAGDAERVIASLTGGQGRTGVRGSAERADIFLTFSGGGNSMEFSFMSDESLSCSTYGFTMDVNGGFEAGGGWGAEVDLKPGPLYKFGAGAAASFERSIGRDRVFAWHKRGLTTTKYTLGDPDLGDKFVLKVGADKRFGTPIFETLGGRSKCPGELGTVFREGGVSLRLPLDTGVRTTGLNPSQIAIYELIVENGSPYREASTFALRIVDGLRASVDELISVAYGASDYEPSESITMITSAAALTSAKDSEIVKSMVQAAELAAASNQTSSDIAEAVFNASRRAVYQGYELADSKFSINGNSLSIGEYMPLKFVDGDNLERQKHVSQLFMNFAIEPGYSTRRIEHLQLRLVSLCESEMGNLYRDMISFTRNLELMSWEQSCPKVQFDQSTISRYLTSSVSTQTSSILSLVVNNPDQYVLWPDNATNPSHHLMNPRLKFVRLQYRPVTGGEWITAKDKDASAADSKKFNFLCAYSRSDGCRFDWDTNGQYEKLLSGFKDGVYELRVKSFCGGASSLADTSVHEYVSDQRLLLTVDTVAPVLLKTYMTQQYYGAEFAEEIDCSNVRVSLRKLRADCSSTTNIYQQVDATIPPYKIGCFNSTGRGLFSLKFDESDVGKYYVSVSGIKDGSGISALPLGESVSKCSRQALPATTASAALGESVLSTTELELLDIEDASRELASHPHGASISLFAITFVIMVIIVAVFASMHFHSSALGRGSSADREHAPLTANMDANRHSYGSAI